MAFYKYLSEERIDVIENSLIRFTQPSQFNDPFEAFPFYKSLTDEKNIENLSKDLQINKNDIIEQVEKLVEKKYKEAQNSKSNLPPWDFIKNIIRNYKPLQEEIEKQKPYYEQIARNEFTSILRIDSEENRQMVLSEILNSINKTIGILSLTEREDNLLMWAHYSNNHKGYVIQFDDEHFFFDRRKEPNELRRYLKKVTYSPQRPELILFNSEITDPENTRNLFNNIFWNKSSHWEYEQEWRMIDTLNTCDKKLFINNQEIFLFSIPKETVKSVIFGCKMNDKDRGKIISLIKSEPKYSRVQLIQASINERHYKLDFKPIQ